MIDNDYINTISNVIEDVQKNYDLLILNQSKIDREINDILHFIEFNKLNSRDSYRIHKVLYSKLQDRRQIKNEMSLFTILRNSTIKYLIENESINKYTERIENQTYTFKELNEDFFKELLK